MVIFAILSGLPPAIGPLPQESLRLSGVLAQYVGQVDESYLSSCVLSVYETGPKCDVSSFLNRTNIQGVNVFEW